MTAAANSSPWSIDQRSTAKVDDVVMHIVVDTINKTVTTLSNAASKLDSPAAAAHIHELSQRLAGIALDALQSWPTYEK